MINANIRERIKKLNLLGPELIDLMDSLALSAKQTNFPEVSIMMDYSDPTDNVQPGEFTAEIHLVVKRVSENV